MKIAAIVILRDEFDILELFFKINSRVIDHFFVIDTALDENFPVLEKLKFINDLDIVLFRDLSGNFKEEEMVKRALASAKNMRNFDWMIPLDMDEFINIDKQKLIDELRTVPDYHNAFLKHSTWVPKTNDFYSSKNPLWTNFSRRKTEYHNLGKVVVPKSLFDGITFSPIFNFGLLGNMMDIIPAIEMQCGVLDHVPVRSSNQLFVKIVLRYKKISLKKDRKDYEHMHWDAIYKLLQQHAYNIDNLLLRYIALTYTLTDLSVDVVDGVDLDSRLGLESDRMEHGYYGHNPNKYLLNFIDRVNAALKPRI